MTKNLLCVVEWNGMFVVPQTEAPSEVTKVAWSFDRMDSISTCRSVEWKKIEIFYSLTFLKQWNFNFKKNDIGKQFLTCNF